MGAGRETTEGRADSPIIRLFGLMHVSRNGVSFPVPASRKTRAIFGYLVLSPRPVSRQRLCELFFDIPDDPRAALRWSLSKLRPLVDDPSASRLAAERDTLRFEAHGAAVDVIDVLRISAAASDGLEPEAIDHALGLMGGLPLEDAELPDRPDYAAWLAGVRQEFSTIETRLIAARLAQLNGTPLEQVPLLRRWCAADPFDETPHARLVEALCTAGRREEALEAAGAAERLFAKAGLSSGPALRAALRTAPAPKPAAANKARAPLRGASAARASSVGRPGLAVIPFLNHAPDLLPEATAEAVLESSIHAIARFKDFQVAGLTASIQHKAVGLMDPAAIGAALGADFLIGGSLLTIGDGLKLRFRIVVAATGALIASGDIDLADRSPLALLEIGPSQLACLVFHHVDEEVRRRAIQSSPERRSAFDWCAAGRHLGFFSTPFDYPGALDAFETAARMAPDWPLAKAYAGWARANLGYGLDPHKRRAALDEAFAAIASGGDDSHALAMAAWSLVALGSDFDAALPAVDLAVKLNPLSRIAWSASAWIRALSGEYETPMEHWRRAEAANPLHANYDATLAGRALCCVLADRYKEAAQWAKLCLNKAPGHPAGHAAAVLAAAALGDEQARASAAARMLAFFPKGADIPPLVGIPIRDPARKANFLTELRAALDPTPQGAAIASLSGEPSSRVHSGAPVVAVLPFRDLSAAQLPAHIPVGFLDGLTHALSRFRSLNVIAAASSARFADSFNEPRGVSEALCADILVGGSLIHYGEGRLRLRWRAIDGETGRLLVSGDLNGSLDALWEFQEAVAMQIAVEVEPRAQAEALRTRLQKPTSSPAAYDLYLQGLHAGFSPEGRDFPRALELLEAALAIDPRCHPALAFTPWAAAYADRIRGPEDLARYAAMSREALRLGRDDARTLATAGAALFYMAHEFGPAWAAVRRAIDLNPNEYTAWICGGWMHAMKGEAAGAHSMFDHAERLNPLAYGVNGLMSGRAMAEFMVGRIEEAERHIKAAIASDDGHPSALMTGVATATLLGHEDIAAERRDAFLRIYPQGLASPVIIALPFEDSACRVRYFEAVRQGGMPG